MTYKYTNISDAVYALKTFFGFLKDILKVNIWTIRILRKIWYFKDSVSIIKEE